MDRITRLLDWVQDRWLTWRTGMDRETRAWHSWYDINVNYRADTIDDMFKNFRHVIMVNTEKFTDYHNPFGWTPCADAKQYFWPHCALADTAVWRFERVAWDPVQEQWRINELGGVDHIFVATNSDSDAVVIALKYA